VDTLVVMKNIAENNNIVGTDLLGHLFDLLL
jgi:hypothetical protein